MQAFHKGKRVGEITEKASCKLLYLPPYSPVSVSFYMIWYVFTYCCKLFKKMIKSSCCKNNMEDAVVDLSYEKTYFCFVVDVRL